MPPGALSGGGPPVPHPRPPFFGSPFMVDEKTIVMGLARNRTLANLQENPRAVFLIMEPAKTLPEWRGVRATSA